MDAFAFHRAIEALWRLLAEANQYLVANEPWKKLKDPAARGEVAEVLWSAMEATRVVAVGLLPILPEKAPEVLAALGVEPPGGLDALAWGGLPAGGELPEVEPIFPRIDKKAYLAGAAAPPATPAGQSRPDKAKTAAPAAPDARISIDDFFGIVLKVAEVKTAEAVPKSKKLLKLTVDAGEAAERTLVAGIAESYRPEDLIGQQVVIVANLKPAKLMGIESNGMVLAATGDDGPMLLHPEKAVANGTRVK
jgi:methionyl-tRNA synthetase